VGLGKGVITPFFTFFVTAGSIAWARAKPVLWVLVIDSLRIEAPRQKKSNRSCSFVWSNGGYESDCGYNLVIIEDVIQAIDTRYKGKMAGEMGVAATYSFPYKESGGIRLRSVIVTNNDEAVGKCRAIRVHGSKLKNYHRALGYNRNLDELHRLS